MSEFDASPPPSKRRKIATYGPNRSTATSPSSKSPSVLRSLSNAVSGISRRLFEPQGKRRAAAGIVESAGGSKEPNRDSEDDPQKARQTEEEQEDWDVYNTGAEIERSAINKNEAEGQADVTMFPSKTKKANRSTKGSMGDGGSQRKSSARRPRATSETMAEDPLTSSPTISCNARGMINHADSKAGMAERNHIGPALNISSSDGLARSPKQRRSSARASASRPVAEDPGAENVAKETGDTTVVNQRSSGRKKRKPCRYSADVEEMAEQHRKPPIGILTPSKRDRRGARKSVAFEIDEQRLEEQFNFRDIEERTPATQNAKQVNKARVSHPKIACETVPLDLSPKRIPVAERDESEENELVARDTALPDVIPGLDFHSITTPVLDSLSGEDEDPHLTAIKAKVILRLTNSSLVPLTNLISEYSKVHSLLKATVTAGEGNSILILGARGSGKTNLIETTLADVSNEHAEDFHVVRLSGFQQTDDKIALREIWRQLGREMQVEEDEINQVSSYADTMASLLHLLSHPEELAEVLEPDAPATTTKSVIFVLDEFDLFTTHPRQTLLYNLFDIAQAKKAPIAVIGCSTRVDVAESLEKRVKSRFSHRWVHLSQPKSFQAFEAIIEAALCLEVAEADMIDDPEISWRAAWNKYIKSTFIPSPLAQALLRRTFYTTKSIPAAFSSLFIPIASITSIDHPSKMPIFFANLTPPDSPLQLLPYLSPLHLYLLISAARLDAIHNASVVNFNLVYHHYVELASRSRLQSSASGALAQGGVTKIWGKELAKGAWEELGDWEVLVPAGLGKGKGDDAPETKMWRVDVTLEEVAASVGDVGPGVSEVLAKWCKEV